MSRIILTALVLCSLFTACTKKPATPVESQTVNLAIWANYMTPEMLAQFEKETGIKIQVSNYSSNEELLAKLQMGGSAIDVAVPSDYMVDIMIKMNLLEALKKDQIPNNTEINSQFLKKDYDPENKYSLPYTWTSTGIAYNTDLYKGTMEGWKDLLQNPSLKGKFALLDDVRETAGAALKMNAQSVNSISPSELKRAKEVLLGSKKNLKMFTSDTIDILKNKEVVAAQTYSSDALQAAAKTGGKIEFILPKEGSTYAIDNLVAVKGGKNPAAALKLINFLLNQENEINRVKALMVGPILKGTRAQLPKELQNNKALFPDAQTAKKLEPIHDLGEANRLYEDLWTEVKTTR